MFRTIVAMWVVLLAVQTERIHAQDAYELKIPLGLKAMKFPADNPLTAAKISLGKQLYFDKRLSIDNTVSCASCHDPKKGWSNGTAFATGVRNQVGGRSAPSIINAGYQTRATFWDGRAAQSKRRSNNALEAQALGPIQNPIEMDMKLETLIPKLNKIEGYRKQFQAVFGSDATADGIAKAIASFERTVLSGNAPYDRYKAGDKDALSEPAQRGRQVFFNKANCSACHIGGNFTDNGYHNLGIGTDQDKPDPGRVTVSKLEGDTAAFKTPSLREIARSAPYMHDGRFKTLEEVIDFYSKGGIKNPQLDEELYPLKLSDQDKADLVVFLKEGLSSPEYPDTEPPQLPE